MVCSGSSPAAVPPPSPPSQKAAAVGVRAVLAHSCGLADERQYEIGERGRGGGEGEESDTHLDGARRGR
jgi:hypothetical protein